jgi:hypothetical protein
VLTVSGPGPGQPFPDQHLIDTLPLHAVDVVEDAPVLVTMAGPKLYPHRVSGQLPEPLCGFLIARITALRSVHSEQPDGRIGVDEGLTVDDPVNGYVWAVGAANGSRAVSQVQSRLEGAYFRPTSMVKGVGVGPGGGGLQPSNKTVIRTTAARKTDRRRLRS